MILANIIATILAKIFTLQQGDHVIRQPGSTAGSDERAMMAFAASPTATSCVTITRPGPDEMLSGMVAITTMDTCEGANFETLFIDGNSAGAFALAGNDYPDTATIMYDTTKISNGVHQFQVNSQSSTNPGAIALGSDTTNYSVQN